VVSESFFVNIEVQFDAKSLRRSPYLLLLVCFIEAQVNTVQLV
jgi:hypothetical protein